MIPNYGVNPRAAFSATLRVGWTWNTVMPSMGKSLANIADGTSNTVAVSKICQGNGNSTLAKVGWAVSTTAVPNPTSTTLVTSAIPSDCTALTAGGKYTGSYANTYSWAKGWSWHYPQAVNSVKHNRGILLTPVNGFRRGRGVGTTFRFVFQTDSDRGRSQGFV